MKTPRVRWTITITHDAPADTPRSDIADHVAAWLEREARKLRTGDINADHGPLFRVITRGDESDC